MMDPSKSYEKVLSKYREPDADIIKTVEMHTCGDAMRIVVSGLRDIRGDTILDKMRRLQEHHDRIRRLLMLEPRGHGAMFGGILVPPDDPEADLGVIFIHTTGYSTMCGHGIISLGRFAVDFGHVPPVPSNSGCDVTVNIQCPCGIVKCNVHYKEGRTSDVSFESVPSFVYKEDLKITVPGFGELLVDIVYGGAFYVFIKDSLLGLSVTESSEGALTEAGYAVSLAAAGCLDEEIPVSRELAFIYGTMITDGRDEWSMEPATHICVFAGKQFTRGPCGSGCTARVALQYRRKQISIGQRRVFQNGKTKSTMTGVPRREETCGKYRGVIVEVAGRGCYTGQGLYVQEKGDEMGKGFLMA